MSSSWPWTPASAEKAGVTRVEVRRGEFERIEGDFAAGEAEPLSASFDLAADGASERRVGEREAAHRRLALERDPRRFVGERAVRGGVECRGDMVERSFRDMDVPGVERAFDLSGRRAGPTIEALKSSLPICGRAGNRAGMDLEIEDAVRRPAALDVEPGVRRDEMQARRRRCSNRR